MRRKESSLVSVEIIRLLEGYKVKTITLAMVRSSLDTKV